MFLQPLIDFSSLTRLVKGVWCRILGAVSVPILRIMPDGRVEYEIFVHHLVWLLATHQVVFFVRLTDISSLFSHPMKIVILLEGSWGGEDIAHWTLVVGLHLRDSVVRLVEILFGLYGAHSHGEGRIPVFAVRNSSGSVQFPVFFAILPLVMFLNASARARSLRRFLVICSKYGLFTGEDLPEVINGKLVLLVTSS